MEVYEGCNSRKGSVGVYIIMYSIIFSFLFIIGYWVFLENNVSFIWNVDGYSQHFPTLIYLGKYYREILWNIIHGNFSIPLYDFNLGTGENIIGVLNYYGLGDILLLLSPLVTEKNAEFFYKFLIVLRMYLCGLSFSYFCFHMKRPKVLTLIGTISYVFCGFAIFSGIRHPYFLNPMITLPLMLIGIEKILKSKKPFLFIVTIFCGASSGFYFFYMQTIMIFFYWVIRYVALYQKKSVLCFAKKASQTFLFYIIGISLSGVVLFPALDQFLSSSRINSESSHLSIFELLFYSPLKYGHAYVNFISGPATWSCIGMVAITMLAVIVLFCKKGKMYRQLQVSCIIGFLLLLIPFGGYALNGFSYIANRWSFAFSFLLAYVITTMIPSLIHLKKIEAILTGIATIVYTTIVLILARKYSPLSVFAPIMLWLFYGACLLFSFFKQKKNMSSSAKHNRRNLAVIIMFILVVINSILNIKIKCDPQYDNYVSQFLENGTGILDTKVNADLLETVSDNQEFYRVDALNRSHFNEGMLSGYNGISTYFSLVNGNIPITLNELKCSPSMHLAHKFEGVDERTVLETLLCTKYLTTTNASNVPYGFKKITTTIKNDKKIELYENKNLLPFGYTYASTLTQKDYQSKSALEKQEIILQAGIVSNNDKDDSYKGQILNQKSKKTNNVQHIESSMKLENISWSEDGTLQVDKKNGMIELTFESIPNSETYLLINGLDSNPSGIEKFQLKINSDSVRKKVKVTSDTYNWYTGNQDYIVNLGYSQDGKNSATISFPEKGTFRLKDIQVCVYKFTDYEEQVRALKEDTMETVVFDVNKVSGTIELSEPKLLCMAMEYDKGWSVYVDEEKTDTCMVNGMFVGVMLEKGNHKIECVYMTPGLKVGAIASLLGFVGILLIGVSYKNN